MVGIFIESVVFIKGRCYPSSRVIYGSYPDIIQWRYGAITVKWTSRPVPWRDDYQILAIV